MKAFFWGSVASLAMSVFYLAIMLLTMSPREVWFNFNEFWYLIVGIVIGFGVQIGLWIFVKNGAGHHHGGTLPGTSGAMSGTAMLACCAHHLADVLPILGLSGAALFLVQYQRPFLVIGLSVNLLGIAYMLNLIGKHKKLMKKVHGECHSTTN